MDGFEFRAWAQNVGLRIWDLELRVRGKYLKLGAPGKSRQQLRQNHIVAGPSKNGMQLLAGLKPHVRL